MHIATCGEKTTPVDLATTPDEHALCWYALMVWQPASADLCPFQVWKGTRPVLGSGQTGLGIWCMCVCI